MAEIGIISRKGSIRTDSLSTFVDSQIKEKQGRYTKPLTKFASMPGPRNINES